MFASVELARRIERAEGGLLAACTATLARAGGGEAFVLPLAGGVAAFSGTESPLTKVAGLGFDGEPSEADLARIEAEFAARGAAVQVELSALAQGGLAERLSARGYALVGFENVLGRRVTSAERFAPREGVVVAPSGPGELATWIDVVVEAFATPDGQGVAAHEDFPRAALERVLRGMAGAEGLVRLLARRAGEPAGGASFHVADGLAQLCGAATLPAHRRRGVQAALLEHRLADAARAGCDLAVVTTSPGSKSQENAHRHGFALLYTRAILRLSD